MKIFNFLKGKSQSKVIFSTVLVLIVLMLSVSVLSFSKGVEAKETACGKVTLVVDKTSCMPGDWVTFSGHLYDHDGDPWENDRVKITITKPGDKSFITENGYHDMTNSLGYYKIRWQFPVDAPVGRWKFTAEYFGMSCKVEDPTSNTVEVTVGEAGEKEEKEFYITLEHIPPTFDIKDQHGGGRIVATVKDKEGNPHLNPNVIFYVEPGSNLDGAIRFSLDGRWDGGHVDVYESRIPAINWGNFAMTHRHPFGGAAVATSYLGDISYYHLTKALMEDGKIKGKIKAVHLDKDPTTLYKDPTRPQFFEECEILCSSSVPVELTCVAKIVDIGSRSSSEKQKVRVMGVDLKTGEIVRGSRQVLPEHLPYELIPGDTILLDENDVVSIHWIDGTKMEIMPKPGFLEKDQFAKVYIGYGDLGLYRKMGAFIDNPWQAAGVGGAGSIIVGIFSTKAGVLFTGGYSSFIFGWQKGQDWFDPLIIESYSTILIDFDEKEEKATVYTVEGTGRLYNINDGSAINVTTGHKITVSPTGEFGLLSEFDKSELNDDLIYVLDAIQEGDVGPSIEGLTFESRSKPSGSSVQIPLTLSGIEEKVGNMDLTLRYDPSVLEATEVIKGSLTTNSVFDYNFLNKGTIKISLADKEGFSGDGSIAYVKFNVIGAEGSSSPLQIVAIAASRAEDYEVQAIPTSDGVFRVLSKEDEGKAPLTPFEPTPTPTTQVKRDSDGDGVPDEYDYAPNDPNVQTKSDITTPGYGAVFAIGSLLAAAFCLRRRR